MRVRTALVVGAGIAGTTLAALLGRAGIATTVIDQNTGLRSSGNPVDVRGLAIPVTHGLGVLPMLRAAATRTTRLVAIDARGRHIGWIPVQASADGFEIPRSDLATILASVAASYADFRRGDTVTALHDHRSDRVQVRFRHAQPEQFDLVVGADGLHSQIRRLTFGPEQQFVTSLGMFVATSPLETAAADPQAVLLHSAPGRAVAVHPGTGREGAAFIFRAPPSADVTDPRQLLTSVYAGMGWRVPELLAQARRDEHLWFDTVSRVHLAHWSHGKTVLVGDAASCISLFGEGSSMAIVGAATLAQALTTHPDDLSTALARYEHHQRARLRHHHRGAALSSHLLVPATRSGTALRNTAFRTWPIITRPWGSSVN